MINKKKPKQVKIILDFLGLDPEDYPELEDPQEQKRKLILPLILATGTTTARAFVIDFLSNGTVLRETGRTAAMAV